MTNTLSNVTSPICGLVCEAITVRTDGAQLADVQNACSICEPWLKQAVLDEPPLATLKKQKTSTADAIKEACQILSASHAPLITGLTSGLVQSQRAAIELADHLGATIDPAISPTHRKALVAMQSVGLSTCTLGEVKQRADVIVFWGANPEETHPSLFNRFLSPQGTFSNGKRSLISLGTKSIKFADECIDLKPEEFMLAVNCLRAFVDGIEVESQAISQQLLTQLASLAARLQSAEYSVFFFGAELNDVASLESLFRLARKLNNKSRCVVLGLGSLVLDNVLTWQTGYPCGVNFAAGYPQYDPWGYSANSLLERNAVDAVLLIGAEGIDELSPAAQKNLAKIPVILIDDSRQPLPFNPAVSLRAAVVGVHCSGTVFRMDGVPLRVSSLCDSQLPTAASLLADIRKGVSKKCD